MILVSVILGALACVAMGIAIGFKYCSWVNSTLFQMLADQGQLVLKTEDGWMGSDDAIREIAEQYNGLMLNWDEAADD